MGRDAQRGGTMYRREQVTPEDAVYLRPGPPRRRAIGPSGPPGGGRVRFDLTATPRGGNLSSGKASDFGAFMALEYGLVDSFEGRPLIVPKVGPSLDGCFFLSPQWLVLSGGAKNSDLPSPNRGTLESSQFFCRDREPRNLCRSQV